MSTNHSTRNLGFAIYLIVLVFLIKYFNEPMNSLSGTLTYPIMGRLVLSMIGLFLPVFWLIHHDKEWASWWWLAGLYSFGFLIVKQLLFNNAPYFAPAKVGPHLIIGNAQFTGFPLNFESVAVTALVISPVVVAIWRRWSDRS